MRSSLRPLTKRWQLRYNAGSIPFDEVRMKSVPKKSNVTRLRLAGKPRLKSVRSRMNPSEWNARVELAAAYRLTALMGWTDMLGTHISCRVPGTHDEFLLNPYGMLFEEITASSLIKVDVDGNK